MMRLFPARTSLLRDPMLLLVLAGVLLASSPATGITQCPAAVNDRIQMCVQPVAEYAKVLNQKEGASSSSSKSEFGQAIQLPKLGGQVFRELCRLIRNFDSCVLDFRAQCPKHITISLIDSSYGYLCNEGYDTFMKSAECLVSLDRSGPVKQCHDETLTDIEKANAETGITMPAKLDRMCNALNFFSGCVRLPIRENCGLEAWQVIFRVLKDTTKTLMPGCAFTGTSPRLHHRPSPVVVTARPSTSRPSTLPPLVSVLEDVRRSSSFEESNDVLVEERPEDEEESFEPHRVVVDSVPGPSSSYVADSSGPSRGLAALLLPLLLVVVLL
uniref:DUF19 domain-containing protein n=1 Tax=Steinernema glaseri TaxID=37863 RepID=A0A1I7Z2J0_9BILA